MVVLANEFTVSQGKEAFLLTHSCTSSSNGTTWGDTIEAVERYWASEPLENAINPPKLSTHTDARSYQIAFRLKS